jgi:glycerate kinase
MNIVIAPDKFKGSLSAVEVAEAISDGIKKVSKDVAAKIMPIADGGEGTVDAIAKAAKGKIVYKEVTGPLYKKVSAKMAIIYDDTAIIEMSEASGLTLIKEGEKNPLLTTTYGTGELVLEAINMGCKRIIIGIGGSATNDCGAGMAQALGLRLLDKDGNDIGYGGGELSKVKRIIKSSLWDKISKADVIVACDVNNPLCGENGASYIYGPQKGATPDMVEFLDQGLSNFADVIKKDLGKSVKDIPGAGAAGGLGAGLISFLDGKLVSGIDVVLNAINFEENIKDADLIITGEGKVDAQSAFGKALEGVGKIAKKYNIPVIAITGSIGEGYEGVYKVGIDAVSSIIPHPMDLEYAMENSYNLIRDAAERAMRIYLLK